MIVFNLPKQKQLQIAGSMVKIKDSEFNKIAMLKGIKEFSIQEFENFKVQNRKQIFTGYSYFLNY